MTCFDIVAIQNGNVSVPIQTIKMMRSVFSLTPVSVSVPIQTIKMMRSVLIVTPVVLRRYLVPEISKIMNGDIVNWTFMNTPVLNPRCGTIKTLVQQSVRMPWFHIFKGEGEGMRENALLATPILPGIMLETVASDVSFRK